MDSFGQLLRSSIDLATSTPFRVCTRSYTKRLNQTPWRRCCGELRDGSALVLATLIEGLSWRRCDPTSIQTSQGVRWNSSCPVRCRQGAIPPRIQGRLTRTEFLEPCRPRNARCCLKGGTLLSNLLYRTVRSSN